MTSRPERTGAAPDRENGPGQPLWVGWAPRAVSGPSAGRQGPPGRSAAGRLRDWLGHRLGRRSGACGPAVQDGCRIGQHFRPDRTDPAECPGLVRDGRTDRIPGKAAHPGRVPPEFPTACGYRAGAFPGGEQDLHDVRAFIAPGRPPAFRSPLPGRLFPAALAAVFDQEVENRAARRRVSHSDSPGGSAGRPGGRPSGRHGGRSGGRSGARNRSLPARARAIVRCGAGGHPTRSIPSGDGMERSPPRSIQKRGKGGAPRITLRPR